MSSSSSISLTICSDLLPFEDDLLVLRRLEARIVELAAHEAEQGLRLVGFFLELHLPHAGPVLILLRLDDVEQQQAAAGVRDAQRRIEQCALHLRRIVHDHQKFAVVSLLENPSLLGHAVTCRSVPARDPCGPSARLQSRREPSAYHERTKPTMSLTSIRIGWAMARARRAPSARMRSISATSASRRRISVVIGAIWRQPPRPAPS